MSLPLPSTPLGEDRLQDRIKFTDADFKVIADLAMRDFGLNLTSAKRDLVYSRLLKRLRILGLEDFRDYCALLTGPNGTDERNAMLSALTTNVTHFFREEHHFKLLREVALPGLIKLAKEGGRVRLWLAGCSAGPEPYSLAFTVLSMFPEAARTNLRILATDVDPEILKKAEAGIYPEDERKGIPEAMRRFTEPAGPGKFTIAQAPRDLITFGRLNLIEEWPISGPFQVIFCRNVAIYFDKPTQSRLWGRFGDMLSPGGYLCIGHSERVLGPAEQMFKAVGITAYQRLNGNGRSAQLIEEPKKMSLRDTIRIMVVDDMSVSRALITQSLEEIGITKYQTENDARNALGKLVAAPVHLCLCDMNMPGMNGLELLHALRTNKTTARMGFILITGQPTPELLKIGQELGLNNLIRKPFTTATMKASIERVVGPL